MSRASSDELLTLHAVRLKGFADGAAIASRFGLDRAAAAEALLDFQAFGWVTWSEFAGSAGWSLTDAGRAEHERQLAVELARTAGADKVHETHLAFLPLNVRVQQACRNWQLKTAAGAVVFNDHSDPVWDRRVMDELTVIGRELVPITARLVAVLDRFAGYDARFGAALDRVAAGDTSWVDRSNADSCHTVWFELHEDLIATLGLKRGE